LENQNHINTKAGLEQKRQKLENEVQETDAARRELAENLRDAQTISKQKDNEILALKEDLNKRNTTNQKETTNLHEQLQIIKIELENTKNEKESKEQEYKILKETKEKRIKEIEKNLSDLQNEYSLIISNKSEEIQQKNETINNFQKQIEDIKKSNQIKENNLIKQIHEKTRKRKRIRKNNGRFNG